MRRYTFAFVLLVAGCGGNGSTTVTPTSTPPASGGATGSGGGAGATGGTDGGMPMPGGGGTGGADGGGTTSDMGGGDGGGDAACSSTGAVRLAQLTGVGRGLAVDDTNVYFLAGEGGSMFGPRDPWSVPIAGGTATQMGTTNDSSVMYMTVNATAVFTLGTDGKLLRWPKSGGAPTVLQDANGSVSASCLADAFGYIYFCTDDSGDDQIIRTPEGGGGTPSVVASTLLIGGIAFDATNLWFDTAHGTFGVPPDGGPGPSMSLQPTSATPGPIAVDAAHVYFGTSDAHVMVADKSDGAAFVPFADTPAAPGKLRVEGGNLYVLSVAYDGTAYHSTVARYAADSGAATTLVDLTGIVDDMEVRSPYLYYTFDSSIYRVCD